MAVNYKLFSIVRIFWASIPLKKALSILCGLRANAVCSVELSNFSSVRFNESCNKTGSVTYV